MRNFSRFPHGAASRRIASSVADGLGLRDGRQAGAITSTGTKDSARQTSNGMSRLFH
ncbi:MAG: hypothetical protein AB7I79_20540 [Rhizobiaceae bacterium]